MKLYKLDGVGIVASAWMLCSIELTCVCDTCHVYTR